MLELIIYLSYRHGHTINEIIDRTELSRRSVFRYLNTIRESGLAINTDNGLYRIEKDRGAGREISDLLHFNRDEAYLLSKAIHSLNDDTPLKANLFKKLYSIYDFHRVADTVVNREHSENVHVLITAMEEKKQVILRSYRSASSEIIRDRLVEPYQFTYNYICVWCFDPEDRKNKLFRVSRINRAEIIDKTWQYTTEHQSMKMDPFRISGPEQISVKMIIGLKSYNLMIEEYPLTARCITRKDDQTYLFEGFVCGFEGIGRFVLGLMDDIEVSEPKNFMAYLMKVLTSRKF